MNANLDQVAARESDVPAVSEVDLMTTDVSPLQSRSLRGSAALNYNVEWAIFIARRARQKAHLVDSDGEPEILPRVWNCPRC